MFHQLHADVWIVEKPLRILRQNIGSRMTIIRLKNGDLWLHSVVKLTEAEHQELTRLGPVTHIVAPNLMHHLALPEYLSHYPLARFYGARRLERKKRRIPFSETLSATPPPSWRFQIEALEIDGIPELNEVVFFHPASRTLILTDLAFNLQEFSGPVGRLLARFNQCYQTFGPTRLFKSLIRDKTRLANSFRLLLQWDFDRIVLAHGNIIETGAKEKMKSVIPNYGVTLK